TSSAVAELEDNKLIATIHDRASLRECVGSATEELEVMIEVDVGLMRLGFEPAEVGGAVSLVRDAPALKLLGVYTHMRVEARRDTGAMLRQFNTFERTISSL